MNYVLSFALSIGVLTLVTVATRVCGWRLVGMLFSIYFGIGWINTIDEAVLFQVIPAGAAFQGLAVGALTAGLIVTILTFTLKRWRVTDLPEYSLIGGWSGARWQRLVFMSFYT